MKLILTLAATVFLFVATPSANAALASWYDCSTKGQCSASKRTASGEHFNAWAMTAAHKTLPLGTMVRVTHKGKSVVVRINDRGPYVKGRTIDLSKGAARKIGCAGVCDVSISVIGKSGGRSHSKKSARTPVKPKPNIFNLFGHH